MLNALSQTHFGAVFGRITSKIQEISTTNDESPDYTDIDLIQHIDLNVHRLMKLLSEIIQKFRHIRKNGQIVLLSAFDHAIWNWIECHPHEFAALQITHNDELARCCETLFDILEAHVESKKSRTSVWPLQIILLILCPKLLKEVVNAEVLLPCHIKKRQFLDAVKRNLTNTSSSNKTQTEWAAVTCVRLCKASTYINADDDASNVTIQLAQSVHKDLKALLFNPAKPFPRSSSSQSPCSYQDTELLIDCWMAMFRIQPQNSDTLRACLSLSSPPTYHLVIVSALLRLVTQTRLAWWPPTDLVYVRSPELRGLFNDALHKATQGYIAHTPLRMITSSLSLKSRDAQTRTLRLDEGQAHRQLLLTIVRLINADPMMLLSYAGGQETQIGTLELINGLVCLVHQPTMPDVSEAAMKALLALHRPEKIEMWNPESPINTFWDVSSQALYSISQKLIQHQIVDYPDVLRWLREILVCRNSFLMKHKEYANVGSERAICQQAHVRLEVVFFMYLWSVDAEAVVTSLSCFGLLCEEADIRCSAEDLEPTSIVPNYQLYMELAQAAVQPATTTAATQSRFCFYEHTQGRAVLQKHIMSLLRRIEHCVNGVQPAWEETFR